MYISVKMCISSLAFFEQASRADTSWYLTNEFSTFVKSTLMNYKGLKRRAGHAIITVINHFSKDINIIGNLKNT